MNGAERVGASPRSFMGLLCKLRWIAVAGQAVTIAMVTGPMQIQLPIAPPWIGVVFLAAFNTCASLRASRAQNGGAAEGPGVRVTYRLPGTVHA